MKPIKRILAGMAAAVSLLALSGCSSQGLDPNHLLVAHSHNENHPVNVGMTALCDEVSGKTQYTFSIYPNGQLGGNEDMIQMVKAGVLDIAKVSSSSLEQFNPAYAIFSLPYTFQSTEHYFRTMRESEAVQEIFRSTYGDGFIAIGWFDSGARSIYTTKDGPCETPDDLRGLKIRTQGSPTSIEMINNMGGAATPMSSGEVYTGGRRPRGSREKLYLHPASVHTGYCDYFGRDLGIHERSRSAGSFGRNGQRLGSA